MKQNRIVIALVAALLISLGAARYVYLRLQQASAAAVGTTVQTSQVVVAASSMKLGTRLGPSDIRLVDWPQGKAPQGTFAKLDDCVGRALITPVVSNEPIMEDKLAPREAGAGLPAAIPEGMRAVSVGVDDVVAVAGFVTPGTMVDVMVSGTPTNGAAAQGTATRTILEDIRVMAVGQEVKQDADGKPRTASIVTLLVTPEQANRVTLATLGGKIHLALRNTIDTKDANAPTVYADSLFGAPAASPVTHRSVAPRPHVAVAPPPPLPFTVRVINGDKTETQSFPAAGKAPAESGAATLPQTN